MGGVGGMISPSTSPVPFEIPFEEEEDDSITSLDADDSETTTGVNVATRNDCNKIASSIGVILAAASSPSFVPFFCFIKSSTDIGES